MADITVYPSSTLVVSKHTYTDTKTDVVLVEVYEGKPFDKNGKHMPHHLSGEMHIGFEKLDEVIEALKQIREAPATPWEKWQG